MAIQVSNIKYYSKLRASVNLKKMYMYICLCSSGDPNISLDPKSDPKALYKTFSKLFGMDSLYKYCIDELLWHL